jgi:hypothetical protein
VPTYTRFVHVVRVYAQGSSGNTGTYVDVMVTDKLAVTGTNGQGFKIDVTAANAVPTINDESGDGNGVDNGASATRQTHIIRVTSDSDPSQYLDVEVLDAFCLTGVNGQQWIGRLPAPKAITFVQTTSGPDLGTPVSPEETFQFSSDGASRWANINELGNNVSQSVTYPLPISPSPGALGSGAPFMAIEDFQKISFTGPNGQGWKYDLSDSSQQINDTTSYLTDPNTGNLYPPQNTDPDPYVIFPVGSGGPFTGNTVVSQGPLWRVINASGAQGPWLELFLAYLAPEGGNYNQWYAYKWQALTDIIPGYVCADTLAGTLQVPPIPPGQMVPTFPPQYAAVYGSQLPRSQVGPNVGNNGYGNGVLFNLGNLAGRQDASTLKNVFLVDFKFDLTDHPSTVWYIYYTVSKGGPPGTSSNVIVSSGFNVDEIFTTTYFQIEVDTDLTYSWTAQDTPY